VEGCDGLLVVHPLVVNLNSQGMLFDLKRTDGNAVIGSLGNEEVGARLNIRAD
jgi:hypothetical protein